MKVSKEEVKAVPPENRDKQRLDWLEAKLSFHSVSFSKEGTVNVYYPWGNAPALAAKAPTLRESIDRAMDDKEIV